ncbi:MAG: hypothetical protein P1P76_04040 [Anaerolineales bacterium]|nr:hypothetical protein [Anaerolineales bacterium]
MRGEEANPLQFEISFPEQQVIRGVEIRLGSMADFTIVLRAGALDSQVEPFFRKRYRNVEPDPIVQVQLQGEGVVTSTLSIEILERDGASEAQIHVREIRWLATALSE